MYDRIGISFVVRTGEPMWIYAYICIADMGRSICTTWHSELVAFRLTRYYTMRIRNRTCDQLMRSRFTRVYWTFDKHCNVMERTCFVKMYVRLHVIWFFNV